MNYIDQTGYKITLSATPKRIVSIVPSQTELLYYLDVTPLAQTIFCIHPESSFQGATKIGGTKKLNLAKIKRLKPDLIVGNKEENDQQQIEELRNHFPVWLSDIYTIDDSQNMIRQIGSMLKKKLKAQNLIDKIHAGFVEIPTPVKSPKVLYLIWREPYMAAGRNTFIQSILKEQGFQNGIEASNSRYPKLTNEDIVKCDPDIILLSSEPYPFKDKHIKELNEIVPNAQVTLVDGELYSWYGPRLLKTAEYLLKKAAL